MASKKAKKQVFNFKILEHLGKSKDGGHSYYVGSQNGKKFTLQVWIKKDFAKLTNVATGAIFHEGKLADFDWSQANEALTKKAA